MLRDYFRYGVSPPPQPGLGNTAGLPTKTQVFPYSNSGLRITLLQCLHDGENACINGPCIKLNSNRVQSSILNTKILGNNCLFLQFQMNYHFGSRLRPCSAQSQLCKLYEQLRMFSKTQHILNKQLLKSILYFYALNLDFLDITT